MSALDDDIDTLRRIAQDYVLAIGSCKNRKEAAEVYADALRTYGLDGVSWPIINRAILNRWKPAGLQWIKARAWKEAR